MGKSKVKKAKKAPLQTLPIKEVVTEPSSKTVSPVLTPVTVAAPKPVVAQPVQVSPAPVLAPITATAPKVNPTPPSPPLTVAVATTENPKRRGWVYSHQYVNGGLKYTRVLDEQGRYLILFQPSAALPLYTEIVFEEGTYKGKPTVTNPVAQKGSKLMKLMDYLNNPDVQATPGVQVMPLEKLSTAFVQKTLVGENEVAAFLKTEGVNFVIGVCDNNLVYEGTISGAQPG